MVTRVNVDLPASLKERLIAEAKAQRRSHRAIVEIALERYFADLAAGRQADKGQQQPRRNP